MRDALNTLPFPALLPNPVQVTTAHFRPNFVIGGVRAHEEDGWKKIVIGDGVLCFRVTGPCSRYLRNCSSSQLASRSRSWCALPSATGYVFERAGARVRHLSFARGHMKTKSLPPHSCNSYLERANHTMWVVKVHIPTLSPFRSNQPPNGRIF